MGVHIGHSIECIRIAKRIKQQEMAKRLDITQQRWSQMIKQENWSTDLIQKVSKIYDMTPKEIQQYDSEKTIIAKEDHNIVSSIVVNLNINGLDAGTIENVIELLTRMKSLNKLYK